MNWNLKKNKNKNLNELMIYRGVYDTLFLLPQKVGNFIYPYKYNGK